MPATRKIMGVGRTTIKQIAGSETFAGLDDVDVSGVAQGAVLYYNGSKFVNLNAGTSGQVLTTNGGSANPSWTNKTSATGIVGGTDRMVQFNDGGSDFGGVEFFEFRKDTNNLMVSGSAGYSFTARASGSSQTTSGIDVYNYDDDQVLQVGHNNLTTESYIWATQTSNNLKFGTNNTKRMEILASNGKVFTSNDLHVSGTLTAGTPTLLGTDSLWAQKGDLAVGTGSDTAQRLSYSATNGQVLTIDTGETTGLKWADPGGVELINRYHVPVASASTGITGSRYVSSPIRIDPVAGEWEDGNVIITDVDSGFVSTTNMAKFVALTQTGGTTLASLTSGAAGIVGRFGAMTDHTATMEFYHNGLSTPDILSKIVLTSGTTTIGATGSHKFILTGGLGITAQSSKPTDSTTKPAVWVSGTSNLLYLSDVGMVTANSSVLSAGYVPYVSGAAKNGIGNSVIYNDASNNRVGINTASPNRAFDVRGTSLLSGNTKIVGTGEITSTLDVGSSITGTGTATFKTASLTNIVLDPSNRAAFIKLQDSSRTATTASRNPEILLNQILTDSGTDKADFPTIRFSKAGPVAADMSYTNLGYRIYVSGETGAGSVNAPQAMIWDFNSDVSDPLNYTEKLALTTDGGLRINNAYTLPTAAPAGNGYVITGATDGTTAWVANSGGGGGGTISGSIADNQIAIGASASDSIEGSANFTFDGANFNITGSSPKIIVDGGGSDDASIELRESATYGGRMYYDGDNNIFMKFTTIDAGTEKIRMAYDRDGNVYLGSADASDATPNPNMFISEAGHVGIGTTESNTRQSEGLTISGTDITSTAFSSATHETLTSLFVPSLGSGSYVLAGIGHRNSQVGDGRAEPPIMVIGDIGTSLHNNAMNSGRAVSLVLAGTAGYNSGGQDYGNFGSLLFHGNSNWSGNARRWLLSNAFRNSGAGDMGLGFAGGDSSAGVDPTISGSTPSVVMSTDSNYGVAGKGGLLVGNTTHIDNGKVTIVDSDNNKQLTLAHDGSNYTTFKTDSSGILTISGATTVTYPPFQVLPGGGIRIDRYTRLMRDTTSNGLNVDDGAGNSVPINVRGVMAGDGYFADPDIGEIQMYSSSNSDGDSTGKLTFNGRDSGGDSTQYAFISGTIHDATHTEEAGQLDIGTLVDGTSTPTMTIVSGNVGIGTSTPGSLLDVKGTVNLQSGHNEGIIIGAENNSTARNDNTVKVARVGMPQYDIDDGNFCLLHPSVTQYDNYIRYGGGTSAMDAATQHIWYTATSVDTSDGTERMRILSDGKVGIGTSSPASALHVAASGNITNGIAVGDTGNSGLYEFNAAQMRVAVGGVDKLRITTSRTQFGSDGSWSPSVFNGTGSSNPPSATDIAFRPLQDDTDTGYSRSAANTLAMVAGGTQIITATATDVTIAGTISATAKSFDIPHPDKEGMRLVHGSLEGPEHGVYARGTAKGHGETTIELPDYWKTLVGDDYTLQLTSYNSSNVYIVDKKEDSFIVNSNAVTYKFDYVVIGRREEIEVEQDDN